MVCSITRVDMKKKGGTGEWVGERSQSCTSGSMHDWLNALCTEARYTCIYPLKGKPWHKECCPNTVPQNWTCMWMLYIKDE